MAGKLLSCCPLMELTEQPLRLLLVDDEEGLRESLTAALELGGNYHVFGAESAERGLELHLTMLPAIVVTDANLPGLQGEDLIREIKRKTPRLPVIGFSTEERSKSMVEAGADRFLSKPMEMSVLLAAIEELLHRLSQFR